MFFYNPIDFILRVEFMKYIFMAFAFLGVTLLIRLMIFGRGNDL